MLTIFRFPFLRAGDWVSKWQRPVRRAGNAPGRRYPWLWFHREQAGEAFAKLYRLTGGELRVLLALAQGLGGKEAADTLGISEPTVRTHLQNIFSKTGTSRQADLLRLLQSSAPPTAAA